MSGLVERLHDLAVTISARLRTVEGQVAALRKQPGITVGTSPPSSPSVNDLWIDTNGG